MVSVRVRIYDPYDLDIIALYENRNFSMKNAMRQAVKYFAAGKRLVIEIPELPDVRKKETYSKSFMVDFDEDTDKEAIAMIQCIPEGVRNSFIKNVFRASLEAPPVSLYFEKNGNEIVQRAVANKIYGRYPVQRAVVERVEMGENEIASTVTDSSGKVPFNLPGKTIKELKSEREFGKREQKPKKDRTMTAEEEAAIDDMLDNMM